MEASHILKENGFSPQSICKFDAGLVNSVFYFEHRGNKYVAKISRNNNEIRKEYNVLNILSGSDIDKDMKTPSLVHKDFSEDYDLLVLSYKPSVQKEVNWSSQSNIIEIADSCGQYLSDIHSIGLSCDYIKSRNKIRSYLNSIEDEVESGNFSEYKETIEYLIEYFRSKDLDKNFIHNDIHPDNMGFENGDIDAVIDWGSSSMASPCVEIGKTEVLFFNMYYRYTPYSKKKIQEDFRESYGMDKKTRQNADLFKILYNIRTIKLSKKRGMYSEWQRISSNKKGIEILKSNLNNLLENIVE